MKVEKNQLVRYDGIVDFYTIAVKPELAPSAITTLELRAADFPPRTQTTMRNSMLSADNGRLAIAVNRDGTFDVSEKSTGKTVRGFCSTATLATAGTTCRRRETPRSSRPTPRACAS